MEALNIVWPVVKMLWPLLTLLVLIAFAKLVFGVVIPDIIEIVRNKRRFVDGKNWRSDRELIRWLQNLPPSDFEKYVAHVFTILGYNATVTGKSHDGGIDIELIKDNRRSYVQCKKYISSKVSVGEVRDFYGAVADFVADGQGFFVTTGIFTLEAQQYVKDKPIELVDGKKLAQYIRLAEKNGEVIFKESAEQKCPECGAELIKREGKFGVFLGCSNYPKCTFSKSVE